jgi:integrase
MIEISKETFDGTARQNWSSRYGERHKLERITDFPRGVRPPKKVRLYSRTEHFVLQWWDPGQRRTLSDRVDGDFLAALTRVRQIEEQLENRGRVSTGQRRLSYSELIDGYMEHLRRRADAGEIDLRTVARYQTALEYFNKFTAQPDTNAAYPHPGRTDREFVLRFQGFLQQQLVSRGNRTRPLEGHEFILATARSAFTWASDPDQGNLLADSFRNPFTGRNWTIRRPAVDLTRELPITVPMAADFLGACDDYQVRLFTPLILFGLRAAEIGWVFNEDVTPDWFIVRCHAELDYLTKGQRDKKFPLLPKIRTFLLPSSKSGLWVRRRSCSADSSPLLSRSELIAEYQRRLSRHVSLNAKIRRNVRTQLLREEGALEYDHIHGEFQNVAKQLNWPASATLKGFRHLFATSLENNGCPVSYRQYFMGQSQGRSAIVRYTHLDELSRHFSDLVVNRYAPIIAALKSRRTDH